MADVYLAVSRGSLGVERLAVIKRLRPDLLSDQDEETEDIEHFITMFRDEARLSVLLKHANIVHTYDVFEEEGRLHLVMEFIEGQSLNALQRELAKREQPFPRELAAGIVAEVLAGLHYAHELTDLSGERLNIVHRDVSPQNVLVGYDGSVKLVDFGVAKASFRSSQTRAGTMKGKARYMAPEQVVNKNVDRRADVYSAGVMLWELCVGRKLISGSNMFEQLVNVLKVPAPRLSTELPDIEPALDEIAAKALARDPAERFETASQMRDALLDYLGGVGSTQPREIGALVSTTFATHREMLQTLIRTRLAAPENDGALGGLSSEPNLSAAFGALDSDDLRSMSVRTGPSSGSRSSAQKIPSSGAPPRISLAPASGSHPLSSAPARSLDAPVINIESIPPPERSRRPLLLGAALLLGGGVFAGVYVSRVKPPPTSSSLEQAFTAQATPGNETAMTTAMTGAASQPTVPPQPAPPAAEPPPVLEKANAAGATSPQATAPARAAVPLPHPPPPRGDVVPKPPSVEPAPAAPSAAPAEAPGFFTLDTYPWTKVTVDGKTVGSTPVVRVSLTPGAHSVVMENPAEGIRETATITIKSGETTSKRLAFDK